MVSRMDAGCSDMMTIEQRQSVIVRMERKQWDALTMINFIYGDVSLYYCMCVIVF